MQIKGWISIVVFLQCITFQRNVEAEDNRHRIRKQVTYTEEGICRSWLPSVNIITPHSLEVYVRFDDFCHKLPHFAPVGFTWAFDIIHSPEIPNIDGRLERFFCNCLNKEPCIERYTDLLLTHNVMYNFTLIPHCFKTLCDNCVRLMLSGSWRNESIIVTPKEKVTALIEEPKTNKIYVFGPPSVALVLSIIILVVLVIFCRHKLLTMCKTQCGQLAQDSTDDTNYNLVPNSSHEMQAETGESTSRAQRKKKVLLINENKNDETLVKFLTASKVMNKYITVDNINDMKHNVNNNFISNLFGIYKSVILVFENWMVNESEVGERSGRGVRHVIQNILKFFKGGSVIPDIRLHVVLIEENEDKYDAFTFKHSITHSTPYYLSRDEVIPPIIHLLVNISSDKMETGFCEHESENYDKCNKASTSNNKDRCKRILLLAEQNSDEYRALTSVFHEINNHIYIDDINTLITSPRVTSNKYDWVYDIPKNYETVVVIQQDWMLLENFDRNSENFIRNTIEELTEIILREHFDRNSKLKLYVVLKNGDRKMFDKFISHYSINNEILFILSADMDFSNILDQMAYLMFSILAR